MDKLDTCMICTQEFKEDQSVVVVDDAKYLGFVYGNQEDEVASFEPNIDAPYRAVYCNDCWNTLVWEAWRLHDEVAPPSGGGKPLDQVTSPSK